MLALQSLTVNTFHGSPRFGHASTFANLFSSDTAAQADYVQGIVVFGFLLVILLTVWLLSLLLLKVTLGRDRIGCAAGGGPILVNDIKKHQPHLKPMLQSMVKRSWRIQSCFIVAALLLPVATALFLFKGLNIMEDALENIQNTNEVSCIGSIDGCCGCCSSAVLVSSLVVWISLRSCMFVILVS